MERTSSSKGAKKVGLLRTKKGAFGFGFGFFLGGGKDGGHVAVICGGC